MAVRVIPALQSVQSLNREQRILRVAAYARVSTDDEAQETSYEAQVQYYTNYIENHEGWELAGIYADEGISGTSTKNREQFNKMIEACENHEIDMVITKSISRWARNTLDSLNYIRKLKNLGIPIIFEKEAINTMDSSGELLITIMSSLAQQESQSISQNVRMGIQYSFQQGKPLLTHTRFIGYTKKKGDKQLSIVPEEAEIVRLIFRLYLEDYSIGDIANELEMRGVRTPGGKDRWHFTTVKYMLQNEKYMGDLLLQKYYVADFLTKKLKKNDGQFPQYYVENAHPPIVPKEVFHRVQGKMMQENATTRHTVARNAIFGKIFCGNCGTKHRRYKEKKREIWRCGKRAVDKNSCDGRSVNETEIYDAILHAFQILPTRRDEIIRMQERIVFGPLDRISLELEGIEERKNELEEIISNYAESGMLDHRTIYMCCDDEEPTEEAAINSISEELTELEKQRSELLIRKGELGIQETNLHTLLKLVDRIMMREEEKTGRGHEILMKTGTDDVESVVAENDAACYDLADFYERTEEISQWGPVTEYNNDLVKRFVKKIVVKEDGIVIGFKAGIKIKVDK